MSLQMFYYADKKGWEGKMEDKAGRKEQVRLCHTVENRFVGLPHRIRRGSSETGFVKVG